MYVLYIYVKSFWSIVPVVKLSDIPWSMIYSSMHVGSVCESTSSIHNQNDERCSFSNACSFWPTDVKKSRKIWLNRARLCCQFVHFPGNTIAWPHCMCCHRIESKLLDDFACKGSHGWVHVNYSSVESYPASCYWTIIHQPFTKTCWQLLKKINL